MSEIDIGEKLQKLREEEEQQLEEMRQKRLAEEEIQRKEMEKRCEEEELARLKMREDDLLRKLEEIRKTKFQLEMEESSWKTVLEAKEEELKRLEAKLDERHEEIWASRDEFCEKIDSYLDGYEEFARSWQNDVEPGGADGNSHEQGSLEREIRELEECLAGEEESGRELDRKLEELRVEMERLEREAVNDPERKRLEDWIQVTRDRCAEMERRIAGGGRLRAGSKPESQLFSMLSVEDVRKLAPFK